MTISSINNNNKTTSAKTKRLCIGGMTTGASVFLASSAINMIMETGKSSKEISQIAKRTGKLGLVFSAVSALACIGSILCENA